MSHPWQAACGFNKLGLFAIVHLQRNMQIITLCTSKTYIDTTRYEEFHLGTRYKATADPVGTDYYCGCWPSEIVPKPITAHAGIAIEQAPHCQIDRTHVRINLKIVHEQRQYEDKKIGEVLTLQILAVWQEKH